MMSFDEFAAVLSRSIGTVHPRLEIGVDKVGELAETLAASYPGHYQPGWAPLSPVTIADKIAKGYPVPSPLKRTGHMAASIERQLDPVNLASVIGSSDPVMLWQERGTSRGIPPRPVLATAMMHTRPFAEDTFGAVAVSILTGK